MMKPPSLVFLSMVFTGTMISVSASSWFIAWIGLEMNLMGFLPMIISKKNSLSSEATLKYFLVSVMSSIFILYLSMNSPQIIPTYSNLAQNIISLPLLLKMGTAPLHSWLPVVSESLDNFWLFILLTWQKFAPLSLLSFSMNWAIFVLFIVSSAIIGSLGGFFQMSVKKILAYSSISHMSWMLSSMLLSNFLWFTYFTLYFLSLMPISLILFYNNISNLNHIQSMSTQNKLILFIFILSLGGLPPFLGFMAKTMVVVSIMSKMSFFILMILVFSATLNIYYYLKMSYNFLFIHLSNMKFINSPKFKMNFLLFMFPLLIWIIF